MSTAYSCTLAIVGAGMAGLMAATAARHAGIEALVVDKGRGVGGRMATRRIGNAVFDHGAQFFTVRDPQFATYVEAWERGGDVQVWSHGFGKDDGHPRYIGAKGMTTIPKTLARSACILLGRRVIACTFDQGWTLHLEDGGSIQAQALLLTSPAPQSLALLEAGALTIPPQPLEALKSLRFARSMALMAHFDRHTSLDSPGAVRLEEEAAIWIADNHRKGISPQPGSVIIHCSAEFAEENWEAPSEAIMRRMLQPVRRFCRGDLVDWQLHRWRYTEPQNPYPHRCLAITDPGGACFAGDAFAGPRVEGAALSGLAAIEEIARHLHGSA